MFARVLRRLRDDIRCGNYVVTLHADEEMFDDGLTIFDIENAILTGQVQERQRTGIRGQRKYRVRGYSLSSDIIEVIVRASSAGAVIITVYRI